MLLLLLLRFVADESDFKHRSGDTVCPSSHGGGGESVRSVSSRDSLNKGLAIFWHLPHLFYVSLLLKKYNNSIIIINNNKLSSISSFIYLFSAVLVVWGWHILIFEYIYIS